MEQAHSKSTLFLIEMMIVILFLAVSSALCVQTFVHAREKSMGAKNLTQARVAADGAAEVLRGEDEIDLSDVYPTGTAKQNGITVYYDSDWNLCEASEEVYRMDVCALPGETMRDVNIAVRDADGQELYSLETVTHIRRRAE